MTPLVAAIALGAMFVVMVACWCWALRQVRHPAAHQALYVASMKDARVAMAGQLVLPIVHRAELVDLRVGAVAIERRGRDAVRCSDGALDLDAVFLVQLEPTREAVVAFARAIGCARSGDPDTLRELFSARFTEAIKAAAKPVRVDEAMAEQLAFAEQIAHEVGADLGGHRLVRVALVYLAPA